MATATRSAAAKLWRLAAPTAQQRPDYYGPREKKKKLPCANPRTKGLGLGLFGSGPYGFCQPAQGT